MADIITILKIKGAFYVLSIILLSAFGVFSIVQAYVFHTNFETQSAFILYFSGFASFAAAIWSYFRLKLLVNLWIKKGIILKMPKIIESEDSYRTNTTTDED